MPLHQRSRRLVFLGSVLFVAFLIGAGGAAPRYNRIVYGALPLSLALICFGAAAYLHASHVRRRIWVVMSICCWLLAIGVFMTWLQPPLAGAVKPEPSIERAHVLLTLHRDRVR